MFNPYVSETPALRPPEPPRHPAPPKEGGEELLGGLLRRLGTIDSEDLILALLVYLLAKEQEQDGIWPILAAALYLLL